MEKGNTDWSRSVTGVVIRDGKVLLCRHTYGGGKGLLIVPGGYIEHGESPQDAVRREEEILGGDGRILLRPSGTEPLIRVMVEAKTAQQADDCASRLADLVKTLKI